MIASVYIKEGNIHFYNEKSSLSDIGGIAYELGRPLLDFVCYEPMQFQDGFAEITNEFDHDFSHMRVKEPEFREGLKQIMGELQQKEIYVFFYGQTLMDFIFAFVDSPTKAITRLEDNIPGAVDELAWAKDFQWPSPGKVFADKDRLLLRAAKDAVAVMYKHLCKFQKFIIHEIEVLLHYRREIEVPSGRSIDYIDILDEYHTVTVGGNFYLEKPFRVFYGRVATGEVEQLYEIHSIEDLFRFEFIKMIEEEIYIKKCKNCERFFIPKRRADAEYCERIWGDTNRKCSEIGATLRYERKVAQNPILEAHKKAYRRFNSRTRAKKMTQTEFMLWSEEAAKKRDDCLAGELPFQDFIAWLEQGRIRKSRSASKNSDAGNTTKEPPL